jgi:putative FmdB family regulatory protein
MHPAHRVSVTGNTAAAGNKLPLAVAMLECQPVAFSPARSAPWFRLAKRAQMPTYQYRCSECGQDLEVVQKFSDAPLTECPNCAGRLRKVYNAVGVVFKGSGFYSTDNRSGAKAGANGSANGSGNGSGGADSSSSNSDSGTKSAGSSKETSTGNSSSNSSGSSTSSPAKAAAD